jgi:hypothetical protein
MIARQAPGSGHYVYLAVAEAAAGRPGAGGSGLSGGSSATGGLGLSGTAANLYANALSSLNAPGYSGNPLPALNGAGTSSGRGGCRGWPAAGTVPAAAGRLGGAS